MHPDSTALGVRLVGLVEFPGYFVGDDGSVWSTIAFRRRGVVRYGQPRRLKASPQRAGYRIVELGRRNYRFVHRLVLEAFEGPCPEGCECRHINGNPADNRLENLAWGTRMENAIDRLLHGTQARGARCCHAKLSEPVIPIIRDAYLRGVTQDQIARVFNVTPMTIWHVVNGRTWNHVG